MNRYRVSSLEKDIEFVPSIPLEQCIRDALEDHPDKSLIKNQIEVHKRMNQLPLRHLYF